MSRRKQADASFMFGLVLGIVVGIVLAMVITPGSGEENRAMLKDKAEEVKGSLEGRIRDVQDKVQ
jgi:gas vesicle protein